MITQVRNKLEQLKGQKFQIEKAIKKNKIDLALLRKSLRQHEQAREVIRKVGLQTQEQLQFHISDITSLAMEAVFPDPYEVIVEFVQRRNKTECDLYFVRDENKVDPMTASGVGAVDVATFALRIASWSMAYPHSRNTIILDEPFRFLSENYQEKASTMIKEISTKLEIQFIIVTHEQILTTYADKIFTTSMKRKITKIT